MYGKLKLGVQGVWQAGAQIQGVEGVWQAGDRCSGCVASWNSVARVWGRAPAPELLQRQQEQRRARVGLAFSG